jgi:peptidoglycan/xylan/chitin deacetylase (PgdA/CDA1 family)
MKTALVALMLSSTTVFAHGQILRQPVPDKLVVLTFDDAVSTHATFVAPLLKQYGFGGTFLVVEFPPDFDDKHKYMTWEQIGALNAMGFEVGNHTRDHTHVDKMDSTQFAASLRYIEEQGADYGIPKPVSFAYPAYVTHPGALGPLRAAGYDWARIGGDRPYDPERDHPYLIPSFTTLAENRDAILDAFTQARDGKIVVLTVHGVPDYAHDWVSTPPALFEEYLRYLHDHDYSVIALRDLAAYVDPDVARRTIVPAF